MSRPYGGGFGLFGLIAALTFVLIGSGIVVLFISFIQPSERETLRLMVTLTLLPGAAAFLLLLFQFGYHLYALGSKRSNRLERSRLEAWVAFAVDEGPLPPGDEISAAALARLRETTTGSYSQELARLYEESAFLLRDLNALKGRQHAAKSRALSRLGRIRSARAIPALQRLLASSSHAAAVEVLRTLARSLDNEETPPDAALAEFETACAQHQFSSGEIESALVLTGSKCPGLVRQLLQAGRYPTAAITVIGHRNLLELVPLLAPHLSSPDPEVRAAALRTVAKIELAPSGSRQQILSALGAGEAFVRAQAAKAAVTLPLDDARAPLTRALGDADWWVRRNAAASLAAFGPAGKAVLARVMVDHGDPFAREIARRAGR
ncbi:MAG TPA: HEAT repeat domain-containing protein [Trueperaceae bacterium]